VHGVAWIVGTETDDDVLPEPCAFLPQVLEPGLGRAPDNVVRCDRPAVERLLEVRLDADVERIPDKRHGTPLEGSARAPPDGERMRNRFGGGAGDYDRQEPDEEVSAHGQATATARRIGGRGRLRRDRPLHREPRSRRVYPALVHLRPPRLRALARALGP